MGIDVGRMIVGDQHKPAALGGSVFLDIGLVVGLGGRGRQIASIGKLD